MNAEDAGFMSALKIPAVLAVIKRVQYDSAESLRILNGYYLRNARRSVLAVMTREEDTALAKSLSITLIQSIGGIFYYSFACILIAAGGGAGGLFAQLTLAANSLTAPDKQFFNAGEWFAKKTRIPTTTLASFGSPAERQRLAYWLGRYADIMGYHSRDSGLPAGQPAWYMPQTVQKSVMKITLSLPTVRFTNSNP